MDIENNKPVNNIIRYIVVFYEEPAKEGTWGSNDIVYELYYHSKDGIMQVWKQDAFGDSTLVGTLVGQFWDRRGRGITLDEMLENIKEISEMSYKDFKKVILRKE